jgi:hypothetical protein
MLKTVAKRNELAMAVNLSELPPPVEALSYRAVASRLAYFSEA